jgi:hypothetical protein
MQKLLVGAGALFITIQIGFFAATSSPANAISADLAKKCRDMAIKAHPYKYPGEKGAGTAQAERSYFSDCVAKGGNMPNPAPATNQSDSSQSPAQPDSAQSPASPPK